MALTSGERQQMVLALPWVTRVARNVAKRCDGLRYGEMPLYALELSDEERRARWGCKNLGHYRFRSLKPRGAWSHRAKDGAYCWSHLVSLGIFYSMEEEARTLRWWRKHGYVK